ncbi:hypothetical protein RI129_006448 [Pyrocoelia pectoralis]|uniref:Uncharacterized protein n=1 Tax=Pyrocoelia pectoralis TaxID=417401 RepID=A0AAN7VE62_9COLE
MPESWRENGMAGEDWFSAFIKRNLELSVRSTKATTLPRATSFNITDMLVFFRQPRKSKRGELVTVDLAVNAIGNSVPPTFIFPCIRFKDHFVRDGPVGCCIGAGNASGWMQEEEFLIYLECFSRK